MAATLPRAIRFVRGPIPQSEDLDVARRLLLTYETRGKEQRLLRERMLDFIDKHPNDAHRRTCLPGHLTSSALELNHENVSPF